MKPSHTTASNILRIFVILILLAALVASPFAGAGSFAQVDNEPSGGAAMLSQLNQSVPRYESAPCMFTMPAGWVEGDTVECGYLEVPEQYHLPEGPTIRLAVAIIRSKAPNRQPDPLVMLQGGPGGSTIDSYTQILPMSNLLSGNRDIILFDQRGTLYSEPALTCPEVLDLSIETLNQDLPDEVVNQMALDTLQECRDRLEADGVNLNAYDSIENAADVESLRVALGYEQINLYGVSYGTLLALHVMRDYPQGLRSVILDSVVPTQTNFVTGAPQTENRSFEALFAACQADNDCNRAYPNLRAEFYALVDQMNDNPVTMQLTDLFETGQTYDALVDGDTLISLVFQMMYSYEMIPLVPRTIFDARDGNFSVVERILSIIVFDRTMSIGMYYTVLCAEDADFTLEDYDLSGLPEQLVEHEDDSGKYILDACALWDVDELGPAVDEPVVSDIPTLVLTGFFDPITPPDYARQAAESLSNNYLYEFPAGGHGQIASIECADSILLQFLDNPARQPDGSCVSPDGPDFVTKSNLVSLPVLIKLLNFADGTGWQLALYMLTLLFLLTALMVYPIVWLVRLLMKKPAPQPAYNPGQAPQLFTEPSYTTASAPKAARQKPLLYRLGPWLAVLAAGTLLLFTAILVGIIFNMVSTNDTRILMGLPGSARLLFVFPILAAGLVGLMLLAVVSGWARGGGSVWGRLYLTLLTLAGIACILILGVWGMLTALIA